MRHAPFIKSAFIFLALSLTALRPCYADKAQCDLLGEVKTRLDTAFGKEYRVKLIEKPLDSGFDGKRGQDSVFLGFADTGHAYLLANGKMFNGNLFDLSWAHPRGPLENGILIRFRVTREQVAQLQEAMRDAHDTFSLTCIRSACAVLRKADIGLPMSLSGNLYPSPTFKQLLKKGAFDKKTGKPIELEVYSFGDMPIESLHESLKTEERELARPYVIFGGGIVAAAAGGTAVYVKSKQREDMYVYLEPAPSAPRVPASASASASASPTPGPITKE